MINYELRITNYAGGKFPPPQQPGHCRPCRHIVIAAKAGIHPPPPQPASRRRPVSRNTPAIAAPAISSFPRKRESTPPPPQPASRPRPASGPTRPLPPRPLPPRPYRHSRESGNPHLPLPQPASRRRPVIPNPGDCSPAISSFPRKRESTPTITTSSIPSPPGHSRHPHIVIPAKAGIHPAAATIGIPPPQPASRRRPTSPHPGHCRPAHIVIPAKAGIHPPP